MSQIYLNALGINNCLGADVGSVREKLFAPKLTGLARSEKLISGRSTWVGRVHAQLPEIPERLQNFACRNNQLILAACSQISATVAHFIEKYGHDRIGVVLGTSTSGVAEGEKDFAKMLAGQNKNVQYSRQEIGNCSVFLANYLNLTGIHYTVSSACASSKKAFASAKRLIDANLCDAVIVGGSDSLCDLTLNGFDSLDSVSAEICNPFSRNRRGINIGEGAALFIMSREPAEIRLLGIGESSDGYHMSSPDPTGRGAELAIRAALADANIAPADVGYINLHGTATIKNDEMEAKVVNHIFGQETLASSTKPMIGHTLGAAGAQELAFCYMALSSALNPERKLPIHHWDGEIDNELPPIRLATVSDNLEKKICISQSFAFGGSNASVVLGVS